MSESISENITWNTSLEKYFADTGEKAYCLSWCHKRAEELFSNRKTWIDLPVIVISAVTGFLSAGSTSLFKEPQTSSVALGVASLFVSILNTAGSYFGWAKRSEGHRISSIHYSKLFRFLSIEMALPREERMTPADLLKLTRDTYDRLQEISPLIPIEILHQFQSKFKKVYSDIAFPEECNGLEKINIYIDKNQNDKNAQLSTIKDLRSPIASNEQDLYRFNDIVPKSEIGRTQKDDEISHEKQHEQRHEIKTVNDV